MKTVFKVVNQLQADGIIDSYAICGAIAASFYLEAVATEDIDIFVHISPPPVQFAELTEIYSYLNKRGYSPRKEFVVIEGWDVQFLVPAEGSPEAESIGNANIFQFDDIVVRVMMPEYLVAVALQTGRSKDINRVREFIKHNKVDLKALEILVERFGLTDQWQSARQLERQQRQ